MFQSRLWVALVPLAAVQSGPAGYTASRLGCATFEEEVRTEIRSRAGAVARDERAGRDGMLVLRATDTDSGLALTAWYDSLTVWREGPEGRIAPDAEGLLGGRWRGVLDRTGRYTVHMVPFVPDEVAEIADLRGVLADFLPLLPDTALRDGATHSWSRRSSSDSTTTVQDTLLVPVQRTSEEAGSLLWDARLGPIRWERTLSMTVRIPAGRPFPRGIVTVVTQRVKVARRDNTCGEG